MRGQRGQDPWREDFASTILILRRIPIRRQALSRIRRARAMPDRRYWCG
ncbi:hypothetical protein BMAPRL20_1311 [Burkholderia mallei PRL-20]|nr:hypothetical protein BMAPRL20_1311 [Burkholderia mallei PRL-20]